MEEFSSDLEKLKIKPGEEVRADRITSIVQAIIENRRVIIANQKAIKEFEQCVYEDLPDDKVSGFILQSEKNHPKLKYEARPAKSGKLNHKDIWSYLKPGEEP